MNSPEMKALAADPAAMQKLMTLRPEGKVPHDVFKVSHCNAVSIAS